jgi:hypothetical protein
VRVWWVVGFAVVPVEVVVLRWVLVGSLPNFPHLPEEHVWPGFLLAVPVVLPNSRPMPGSLVDVVLALSRPTPWYPSVSAVGSANAPQPVVGIPTRLGCRPGPNQGCRRCLRGPGPHRPQVLLLTEWL